LTRLIDLVAEDNAIEDTIYHLARALDTERIDLDRFLKVRRAYRPRSFPLVFGRRLTQIVTMQTNSKSASWPESSIRNER
jgi:hypothetical protein